MAKAVRPLKRLFSSIGCFSHPSTLRNSCLGSILTTVRLNTRGATRRYTVALLGVPGTGVVLIISIIVGEI